MAKRRGKGGSLKVRQVHSAEERNQSQFFSLPKTGDSFTGIALFSPDPELDDNPGYLEYFDHWDNKENSYVPCAGPESCVYCKGNDRPSTRAKTLWLIDDEIKIFTLNWSMINEFADMLSEDETVLGQSFRIKRLDDRGKYRITPKADSLTKKKLEKLLEGDDLPDLEDLVNTQLRRAYEDIDVASAMEEDDDDDDEDDEPKARRGKEKKSSKKDKEEEDDDNGDEEDDLEDEDVTVESVSKKNDTIKVSGDDLDDDLVINVGENDVADFKKGMDLTISTEYDEDDEEHTLTDWSEQGEEDDDEDEKGGDDDDELPDEIEDEVFEIVKVDAEEETLDVKSDDHEFTLYFLDEGDASEVDFDDYEEGDNVTLSAVKDNEGDMVATTVPKKKKSSGKKSSGKKGGKKKSSKKK